MTLKENIMKLQTYKMFESEDTLYVERDDVLKLLEQEPSGDLISKQAVIDAIKHAQFNFQIISTINFADYKKEVQEIVDNILSAQIKAINDLPSVNPQEPKWIPVSERLPEHYQNILFSTKTDRVFEGKYFKDETEHQWYSFRDECFAWNNVVTAWMPLPEPYKAESEV